MQFPTSLQTVIQQKLPALFPATRSVEVEFNFIGGGSINQTYRINIGDNIVFCKINSALEFPQLFQKENHGLETLAKQHVIKTPLVIEHFQERDYQVLLLEWIQEGSRTEAFWKSFGEQLAALHRSTAEAFGFNEDNYMGSVSQQNTPHQSWVTFFTTKRLTPMVKRCMAKGLLEKKHLLQFEALQKRLADVFNEEPPSLLHGDLWSGNFMCNESSEPVLIDPAVHFGHRSVDLAMTTLFGGFRNAFYEAYAYHFPLPPNYEEQWAVCNLYALLIHLYLFGSGYLPQIERTLKRFS